jgi:dTDP-4-dehydrorhamnose 3,5-epimerase
MPFSTTPLKDLLVFEPKVFEDSRGFFFESYNENTFKAAGINFHWVQDNQSLSSYGLSGIALPLNPYAQVKLVRVLVGEILDVVVDIRKTSPTYGHLLCN